MMNSTCNITSARPARRVIQENGQAGMLDVGGMLVPPASATIGDTGIDQEVLANLALKMAYTVPRFSTEWAAQKLCLPLQLAAELLDQLRKDNLVEVLGQSGAFGYQFAITGRGRERAVRLLEISGYVGPAPVSLAAYASCLERQFRSMPQPSQEQVNSAIRDMVLPEDAVQVAGLAMLSRRSLFLYGPPGNGKTCLGHLLHDAVEGDLWIPHCLGIENNIIRVFDPECHQRAPLDLPRDLLGSVDQRWVRIRRPFIVVGGELTIEALDLLYSHSLGYYEAPLHFKANGGTFLLDDFGCQRVSPQQLLNRWIHPLERGVDFLTLQTGQQLEVPFRQMLIVSTNLDPDEVMSPAFLRRMGYRLYLGDPSAESYAQIFHRYAAKYELAVPSEMIDQLITRYQSQGRPRRSCEPRDLVERVRDICRYQNRPLELDAYVLDVAWRGYFGNG